MVLSLTPCPCAGNSRAKVRVLLQVHRNGDGRSPRVSGSPSFSSACPKSGSSSVLAFRPAPGRRTRAATCPRGGAKRRSNSACPLRIVVGDRPGAGATATTPPIRRHLPLLPPMGVAAAHPSAGIANDTSFRSTEWRLHLASPGYHIPRKLAQLILTQSLSAVVFGRRASAGHHDESESARSQRSAPW
jgi:hypothetical protein